MRGLSEAIEQYLFEERRDVLRLVTSAARPDDEAQRKISAVQERMIDEYGYDEHSAREALSYVTTLARAGVTRRVTIGRVAAPGRNER